MTLSNKENIELLFDRLFPIARSITGEGFRESLDILKEYVPLKAGKVASGTKVFDWTVPKEWKVDDAYLIAPDGEKILDFKKNPLALVNYSEPVDKEIELDELQSHLHSIVDSPNWTPYVTSYYKKTWGFCLTHNKRKQLKNGSYRAVVKSSFIDGYVEYGHTLLKSNAGDSSKKPLILISSYLCHPNMANNELSGPIILAALYERISKWQTRRFDYLFLINPETIGSICYLYHHSDKLMDEMQAGLVLTCLGGPSHKLSYKKSRYGFSSLDKLFLLLNSNGLCDLRKFDPTSGSDERQYCAGTFNLPVGQLARTVYGSNPEYHTSADNKDFVQLDRFVETVAEIEEILKIHEYCKPLQRYEPNCEINLGRRNLYPNLNSPETRNHSTDSLIDSRASLDAIGFILSYADGNHDIFDISKISQIDIKYLTEHVQKLIDKNILR
jgi:aminopeptidase-like protein